MFEVPCDDEIRESERVPDVERYGKPLALGADEGQDGRVHGKDAGLVGLLGDDHTLAQGTGTGVSAVVLARKRSHRSDVNSGLIPLVIAYEEWLIERQ